MYRKIKSYSPRGYHKSGFGNVHNLRIQKGCSCSSKCHPAVYRYNALSHYIVSLHRCGQETRVVPRILQMRNHWYKSSKESLRLKEAGVSEEVINSAVASFILEVIARHGVPAPRLCNKDPLALKSMDYLKVLFPNAKYIFMVRDGRATVHSIISRRVSHIDIILQQSSASLAILYGIHNDGRTRTCD